MNRPSALVLSLVLLCAGGCAQTTTASRVGSAVVSDLKWTANNAEADAEDVVTSPLHVSDLFKDDGLVRQPTFYYAVLGTAALFGGAFALDQTVRARLRSMPNNTANDLETAGGFFSYGVPGLVYVYGLAEGDDPIRHDVITGYESSGIASLITLAFKSGFGRVRPRADHHSHTQFFDNGDSFVSGAATPVFALACATSEAFDNHWYVAVPAYAGALAVGFGRIGHDAHWLSDIAGSAIVGVGTTELLLWLHRRHELNPSRFRIFPVAASGPQRTSVAPPVGGLGINFTW